MKKINKILIITGILLVIAGGILTGKRIIEANNIVNYDGNNYTNKQVLLSGKLINDSNAKDDLLGIETDSPVLIRNVSMVQWYKDEDGIRLVLANYPLESFKDGDKEYNNPEFPNDITSEVFTGSVRIEGYDLKIGSNVLKALSSLKQTTINELPENNGNNHNLTYVNGAYVTASDDWNLGDIKVTYSYIDVNELNDISILSSITSKDGLYILDSENSIAYDRVIELKEIRSETMGNMLPYYGILGVGVILIVIGFVIKKK